MEIIDSLTIQDGLIIFLILLVFAGGFQLNRLEKQNEGLWNLIREVLEKVEK